MTKRGGSVIAGLLILLPSIGWATAGDVEIKAAGVYCAAYKLGLAAVPMGACPFYSDAPQDAIPADAVAVYTVDGMQFQWYSMENVRQPGKTGLIIVPGSGDDWAAGSTINDFNAALSQVSPAERERLAGHVSRVAAIYGAASQYFRQQQISNAEMAVDDAMIKIAADAQLLGISDSISLSFGDAPWAQRDHNHLDDVLVQRLHKKADAGPPKDSENIVSHIIRPSAGDPGQPVPGDAIQEYFGALLRMGRLAGADVSGVDSQAAISTTTMAAIMSKVASCPEDQNHAGKAHQGICPNNTALRPELALSKYGPFLNNMAASTFNQVLAVYSKAADIWQSQRIPTSSKPKNLRDVHLAVPADLRKFNP